jgi:hypothetical protein
MAAVSASETSVNLYPTVGDYNSEDSRLYTPRLENLKSHLDWYYLQYRPIMKLIFICVRHCLARVQYVPKD